MVQFRIILTNMALIFNAVVIFTIATTFITNIIIVITLKRTKLFNHATKLHLSIFTICDLITGLLIGCNVLFIGNGYDMTLVQCKISIGFVLFMCNVMIITFISMTIECISMLYVKGWLSTIRFFGQKGRNISVRGYITLIIMIIHPAILNIGLVVPSKLVFDRDTECLAIMPSVYHPLALKIWTGQLCIAVCLSIVLNIWLYHKLKINGKRTESLLSKRKRYTGNAANNIMPNGSNHPDSKRTGPILSSTGLSQSAILNKKRLSSAHITLLAASFYNICYFPSAILMTINAHCPDNCGIDKDMIHGASALICLHGLLNAVIYILKNKDFKKTFMDTFCTAKRVQQEEREK